MDIQTALQADLLIKGRKLRELLDGLTNEQFIEFVERHCTIPIPNTGLTEEDLKAAIKEAGVDDPKQIDRIARSYIKDAVGCSFDYDLRPLQDDFNIHVDEYVSDYDAEDIQDVVNNLTRAQCEELLASISIQVYGNEKDEELREAVLVNYEDSTISKDDIRDVA